MLSDLRIQNNSLTNLNVLNNNRLRILNIQSNTALTCVQLNALQRQNFASSRLLIDKDATQTTGATCP